MDKFGVFRLLNSFLDFYKNNRPQSGKGENSGLFNLFSGLSGKIFTDNARKISAADQTESGKSQNVKTQNPRPPIINPMLKIMKDHDDAVKRVKKERP